MQAQSLNLMLWVKVSLVALCISLVNPMNWIAAQKFSVENQILQTQVSVQKAENSKLLATLEKQEVALKEYAAATAMYQASVAYQRQHDAIIEERRVLAENGSLWNKVKDAFYRGQAKAEEHAAAAAEASGVMMEKAKVQAEVASQSMRESFAKGKEITRELLR